ncbi:MAG TPA: thermopsin family protease, partial [Nitrososphaerales archaeon]|nr:thermopsin family protease [Nitrososphaerales archaeon]
ATLSVSVFPNNPLGSGPLTGPLPMGIASYGLTNQSGVVDPYAVASTDVIGLASVSSLQAYNASASSVGSNPSGATLQLNSMLVVDEGGAANQVYWCQNTPDFVTATSQLAMSDNVWNASRSGVLTNDSVTSQGGAGYVSTLLQNGTTLYFYAVVESNSTYTLPLGLVLLMNATAEPGTGVLVQFGAKVAGGSISLGRATDWFDNVTIHDPGARSAYFATDGNYSTPLGNFYDTELVFAGEGGGESTNFTSLSASLGLFYANGTSPVMSAFPSYFSFGRDTAEAAYNLRVSYLGNGKASLAVGSPNYTYLGAASGAYSLAAVEASLNFPGSPANSTTTSASTTAASTLTSASTASRSTTAGPGGIPEFPFQILAASAAVVLIALAYLAIRRRSLSSDFAKRL